MEAVDTFREALDAAIDTLIDVRVILTNAPEQDEIERAAALARSAAHVLTAARATINAEEDNDDEVAAAIAAEEQRIAEDPTLP